MPKNLPDFIIIGAQKSGSTYIHKILSEHPEVYLLPKEIQFFESPCFENHTISDLQSLFIGKKTKLLGIKRPDYLAKPEVPPRIKEALPDVKLIVSLRNPIERAISAYYFYCLWGYIPAINIETGLNNILEKKYNQKYKMSNQIIEYGFYYKYLNEYLRLFNKGQIHILLYDDLIKNKDLEIKKLYNFLEITDSYIPEMINKTILEGVYNMKRIKLLAVKNQFLLDKNNIAIEHSLKNSLTSKFISSLINKVDNLFLSKIFKFPEKENIPLSVRSNLLEIYKKDIDLLEKLIDRDLSAWKAIQLK